jgi:hypothetical protein
MITTTKLRKSDRPEPLSETVCVRLSRSNIEWLDSLKPFTASTMSACIRFALKYAETFTRQFGFRDWVNGKFDPIPYRKSISGVVTTQFARERYFDLFDEELDDLDALIGQASRGVMRLEKELSSIEDGIDNSPRPHHNELEDLILRPRMKKSSERKTRSRLLGLMYDEDRKVRVLHLIILRDILLNQTEFKMEQSLLDQAVVDFETDIVNRASESEHTASSEKQEAMDRFRFVLETAWDANGDISPIEEQLLERLRARLKLSRRESRVAEAQLGFFPKIQNEIHLISEVQDCRDRLQKAKLLDKEERNGKLFDIIPDEIVVALRSVWGIEIRSYGYDALLQDNRLNSTQHLMATLDEVGVPYEKDVTIEQLRAAIKEHVRPSELLGGFPSKTTIKHEPPPMLFRGSPKKGGLDHSVLSEWCKELGLSPSGQQTELASRIVQHFDAI